MASVRVRQKRLLRFLALAAGVLLVVSGHGFLALIALGAIGLWRVRRRITPEHKGLLVVLGIAGITLHLSGFGPLSVVAMLALTYLLLRFGTEPIARFIARRRYSIRWKFEAALSTIGAMFLIVSLIGLRAMDSMHAELHAIQDLGLQRPAEVLAAVNALEDTRHTLLNTLTPIMSLGSVLVAAALAAAMARSIIEPVQRMGLAMRGIASGNFSGTVHVENRDELGELAGRINETAGELAKLHEETLAAERARALQERIGQGTLAQEVERRRISRELHDGIGPSLAAIRNRLRACGNLVRSDSGGAEKELKEIADGLTGHIKEIRELAHNLRPLALDQLGLLEALRQHVDRFGQETGMSVSFTTSGDLALNPLAEVTVLRIVQESLGNIQKHADATQVEVDLKVKDSRLEASITDNGRGFNPGETALTATEVGLGLVSMRERAELLGGSLLVESSPGKGCRVRLQLPLEEAGVGTN